jgi:hypothetical protein
LVVRSTKIGQASETIQIDLDPGTDINGQPSWSSSTGQYLVYWNTGSTPSQWTMTGYSDPTVLLINNDPADPPISNWQALGTPSVYSIDLVDGVCSTAYTVSVSAVVNDAICGSNGSIIVSASGGQPPYQYSINAGSTYQSSPIFNGLTPGNYTIFVQDVNTTIGTLSNLIVSTTNSTTYNLTLSVNYASNTFSINTPVLPAGVTVTFDLVQSSNFSYYPSTLSPLPTYNNTATVTGVGPLTLSNTSSNTIPLGGACATGGSLIVTQQNKIYTSTLTMGSNQTFNGTITNSVSNSPTGSCASATGYYILSITNNSINNCACCTLNVINPPPPPL